METASFSPNRFIPFSLASKPRVIFLHNKSHRECARDHNVRAETTIACSLGLGKKFVTHLHEPKSLGIKKSHMQVINTYDHFLTKTLALEPF